MSLNPYAPPKTTDDSEPRAPVPIEAPALWNPNAATNWSLLFTPAFGAYLHMMNWRALGETEKAATAKIWFSLSIAFALAAAGVTAVSPRSTLVTRNLAFGYLVAWYYAQARSQATYVKGRFGKAYPRKGWSTPILIAVGATVVILLLGGVLAALLNSTTTR